MKSLYDYIAEVAAKAEVAPAKVPPKPKKKSDPYHELNREVSDDSDEGKGAKS